MKSELGKILKHTLIYGAGGILSKMIGFLLIPLYTRFLTPADYGVIELLDLTLYLMGTLIGYSISSAMVRFYYKYKDEREKAELIFSGLVFLATVSFLVILGVLPFADAISRDLFKADGYGRYFKIILCTLFFQLIGDFCFSYIQVRQESLKFTLFSIAKLGVGLILNILFVVVLRMGALGIIYSSLITAAVTATVLGLRTLSQVGATFSREKLVTMLTYGYPLVFGALSTFVLTFSDRYFLNHFTALSEVGLYALGYKLSMLLPVLVTSPFLSIWSAKRFELSEMPEGDVLASRVFTYFAFAVVIAALGISVFSRDLLQIITTKEFYGAHRFIPVLVLGYMCNAFYYHFNFGMYVTHKTKYVAFILISGAALNTGLNYLLIKPFHGMGAATATALSFFYVSSVTYFIARRLHPLPYEFTRVAVLVVLALGIYFASLTVDTGNLFWNIGLKALLVLAFPLALYPLRFYKSEEILKLKALFAPKANLEAAV